MSARSVAVVATAALLASAACGSSSGSTAAPATATTATTGNTASAADDALDPGTIEATVLAAAESADAVHIKGADVENGDTATIDLQLNVDSGSGTLTNQGVTYPITLVNKVYYLQFTAGVLKAEGGDPNSARGRAMLNKWVPSTSKTVPASTFAPFEQILGYATFVTNTFTVDQDKITRTGTDTVNGTPVIVYHDNTQNESGYVSAASPHYMLRVTSSAGTDLRLSGRGRHLPRLTHRPATPGPPAPRRPTQLVADNNSGLASSTEARPERWNEVDQTAVSSARRLRVRFGSTGMPGPMVVVKVTFFRYRPFAADGLARRISSSAAA
jgi:hypothetical protein